MTRYPDLDRALRQLNRHRSGTPNTPPPVPPWWAVKIADFGFSLNTAQLGAVSAAQFGANIQAGWDPLRGKQETT